MARIESKAKGGYYPTPEKELELILKKINAAGTVTVLDPCAGEGLALNQIVENLKGKGSNVEPYAVELESSRAEKARELFGRERVIKGGYEGLRMTNDCVSLLFLNPPYDERFGKRVEEIFFRDLTAPGKYLVDGGLVVLIIPQYVLKDIARLAEARLDNVTVYRFTDENYPVYNQVVLFGTRKKGIERNPLLKKTLEALAEMGPSALPSLDMEDNVTYDLPEATKPVTMFRGSVHDPVEIAKDVMVSPAWEWLSNKLLPPSARKGVTQKPAVLPEKIMHFAVRAVSGDLPENFGSHILTATTVKHKEVEVSEEIKEDGKRKETRVEIIRDVTKCFVFAPTGVHVLQND
ncbi:hypothetical protein SAMN02745133_01949 [Desulforamulus putei DSM 12395]|uniref:DUF6094 domain-containing protein n=1 Tax=Desulforamulus putei DSM 12395 TaxID=1121429 RepID=A0A1M4ZC35_9FIRM|nr:DUF6094 domain-containing protein [Desulforamulus putei]SHF15590.1 hypothetical protein SAMN02745133_01949 [Desulforamulus putei DSM 12395]